MIVAIVVGVLVVVGGGVAAAVLLLGGDDEGSTSSPLETAESFAQAWRDADCDALESLLTDRLLEGAQVECQPDQISGEPGDPEITEQSDDEATAVMSDGDVTYELQLVKEDDGWLIDGFGGSASSPTPPAGEDLPQPAAPADAQALVDSYVEAMRAGDCATIEAMSSETLNSSTDCNGDIVAPPDVEVELGDPQMVSDTAATLPAIIDGDDTDITLMLSQEDGQWQVSKVEIAH